MSTMARRIPQPVARRVSLPLTEQDERELARLRHDPTYRAVLASLAAADAEITGDITESVLLHTLLRIGLTAVETAAQQAGYDELAADYQLDDRRRVARRRQPSWAGEV